MNVSENRLDDTRRRRGRPSQITRQQVIAAAAKVGMQDLTVQSVADELGVTRAAIYHYVDGVDDLLRIVVHETLAPFAVLDDGDQSWQEWLWSFARACRSWAIDQADLLYAVPVNVMELPWFLRILDRGVDVLVQAGFPEARAAQGLLFLGGIVRFNADDELAARSSSDGTHRHVNKLAGARAAGSDDLVHLRADLAHGAFDPDTRFEREIQWAIRALEMELRGDDGQKDRLA